MKRALLFLIIFASSSTSLAVTTKICFRTHGNHEDSGFALSNGTTEDYWKTTSSKKLRGNRYILRVGGYNSPTIIANGYLGDGLGAGDPGVGCSTSFIVAENTRVYLDVRSYGKVQDNDLRVFNPYSNATTSFNTTTNIGSGGTRTKTIYSTGKYERILRIYATMAYGLYRHAGGVTGKSYDVYPDNIGSDPWGHGAPGGNTNDNGKMYLTEIGSKRKFVMIHELGHRLSRQAAGDKPFEGGTCGLDDDDCEASSGSHSMGSKENQTCAFKEGFAHFYSADVFNSHSQTDCVFRYYKDEQGAGLPTINCESSTGSTNGSYPTGFLEAQCLLPWVSTGTELDWLRQLWDVHTNASSPPSFNTMIDWIRTSPGFWGWDEDDLYDKLDARANVFGGTLNSNWDQMKGTNDIDH